MTQFTISTRMPTTPENLYRTWLNSKGHADMTGVNATISDQVGDVFKVYSDYITGRNVILIPGQKIVQQWRTAEFKPGDESSHLEIILEAEDNETKLTIHHSHIPQGLPDYAKVWEEYYFMPMRVYFSLNK